jgi:3-hydroxyisobutyrate dehydrogenase-like beta-hydroxyacid dehydrogenase
VGSERLVGWVGIGKMGNPMSRRVLRSGFPVTVLEPLVENRATVVAEGASVANTAEELAAAADIVISTIPNDAVLRDLVLGPDGLARFLREDQIFVEMSTVSPSISAEVAAALADRGVAYLRAPVSGSTTTAGAGKLTVLASGPKTAFDACLPVFESLSVRQFYVGPAEEARYAKLVLNALVGATSALLGEALTLGQKGHLSIETMLNIIAESAVASPLIAYKRDLLLSRDFDPAFSVSQMMKDFDLILDAARSDHVPMQLTALIRQQYEAAFAEGLADKDFFVLVEQAERLAGLHDSKTSPR